jgi:catechol 2,3-dioxygenase-like lactoylglutathione lyase family enzyme
MHLDHINLATPKDLMEKVREFYCQALQLEDGARPDFGIPGYWLYGEGRPLVHLIESDNHYPAEQQPYLDHVAFRGEHVAQYVARLQRMGVEHRVSHIADFDLCQVFCKDPAGTGVEVNFFGEKLDQLRSGA